MEGKPYVTSTSKILTNSTKFAWNLNHFLHMVDMKN